MGAAFSRDTVSVAAARVGFCNHIEAFAERLSNLCEYGLPLRGLALWAAARPYDLFEGSYPSRRSGKLPASRCAGLNPF